MEPFANWSVVFGVHCSYLGMQLLTVYAAVPYELTNLIGFESHRKVSGILRERLIRYMVQAGETVPLIEPAPTRASGQRRVDAGEVGL